MGLEQWQFQVEDIEKLSKQKCALIGSEMGTGKTLEAVKLDELWWPEHKLPTLVVAPRNTFDGWISTYQRESPQSDLVVIDRKNRAPFEKAIEQGKGDVFLCHWESLRLMPVLGKVKFGLVIADEVHRASNRKSQQTRALKKIRTVKKLGLSGTASGDNPAGLWSVLNWLWPSYYSSYWAFVKYYCVVEKTDTEQYLQNKGPNPETLPQLHKEMRPWYVRHLKREKCCEHHPNGVMHWLPEKTYSRVWVDLSPAQRRVYNEMKKNMVAWVNEHEDTPLVASIVVAQLARLSQMTLATPEVVGTKLIWKKDKDGNKWQEEVPDVRLFEPSSKLDALLEILQDHPEKKFVVYTSSKQMANLVAAALKRNKINSFVLSGDTPDSQRTGMAKRFAESSVQECQAFIGVIAAISEGIDGLQWATDTGIFLDRDWSTLKNNQAEDRLHRGGQKNTVHIIDIMAKSTVDLGRHQRLEEKWAWIKAVLGDKVNQATGKVAA